MTRTGQLPGSGPGGGELPQPASGLVPQAPGHEGPASDLREALADHVARLKHDLGKYVALQSRWLEPDAGEDARREALANDLLATRRGPNGIQDAVSVWAEFRPALMGDGDLAGGARVDLSADPDVLAIDAAMSTLGAALGALRAGALAGGELTEVEAAARVVADRCRSLAARARQL